MTPHPPGEEQSGSTQGLSGTALTRSVRLLQGLSTLTFMTTSFSWRLPGLLFCFVLFCLFLGKQNALES